MDWMGLENDLNIETWEMFKVRSISRCIISSQKGLMKKIFDKYDSGSLKKNIGSIHWSHAVDVCVCP